MSPPAQLHADARDVDDPHFIGIALTGHEDSTCRAITQVKGQGHTDCTELYNQREIVPSMLMTACRYWQLPPDRIGSSHHMMAMQKHCGSGGTRACFPNLSKILHCYWIGASLRVNQWAIKTSLAGGRRRQVSDARSGD